MIIETGLNALQEGNWDKAEQVFNAVLSQDPQQVDALHGLGMVFACRRQFPKACEYFSQAVAQAPNIAPFHNNYANALKANGDYAKALAHYQQTLKLQPNHANAMNNIGALLYKQGQVKDAISMLQRSIQINPEHANTHFNIALCYLQNDQLLDAVGHLQETLKLEPNHTQAAHNLGIALCTLKDYTQAKRWLTQACENQDDVEAWYHLGLATAALNEHNQAIDCYLKALQLEPQHTATLHNIAISYLQTNDTKNAKTFFAKAVEYNPRDDTAKHMFMALSGETPQQGAPTQYVRALFNQYAPNYNEHMQSALQAKTPLLLRQAFTPLIDTLPKRCKILDLGCGTGLIAPLFNDISDTIIGVDAAENMLMLAKQQGGYSKLYHDDIVHFLQTTEEQFDIILLSDVLVYFGDCENLFQLCAKQLNAKGYLALSIENSEVVPYQLDTTGRFQHHPDYCAKTLQQYFTIHAQNTSALREQQGEAVMGSIFLCCYSK